MAPKELARYLNLDEITGVISKLKKTRRQTNL